jgi:hypothetical protein
MRSSQRYEIPATDTNLIDSLRSYGLVYVATPFSKYEEGMTVAYEHACQVTGELLRYNINAFSPIVHSYGISAHANIDPLDHKFWMRVDKPHMDKCDALVVAQLDGWDESIGVGMEIKAFRNAGKPIHFIRPQRNYAVIEMTIFKLSQVAVLLCFLFLFAIALFSI